MQAKPTISSTVHLKKERKKERKNNNKTSLFQNMAVSGLIRNMYLPQDAWLNDCQGYFFL